MRPGYRSRSRGAAILLLSDRAVAQPELHPVAAANSHGEGERESKPELIPIPMALATGAVHHALVHAGVRTHCGLAVEAGDCRDLHHAAVLIGFGAAAVCPWLALETARSVDADRGEANMLHAFALGLAKIMSKMGISVVNSYRGAHLFDAIGLDQEVIDRCFEGTPSPIGGIGFAELEGAVRQRWSAAQEDEAQLTLVNAVPSEPAATGTAAQQVTAQVQSKGSARLRLDSLPQGRTRRAAWLAAADGARPATGDRREPRVC